MISKKTIKDLVIFNSLLAIATGGFSLLGAAISIVGSGVITYYNSKKEEQFDSNVKEALALCLRGGHPVLLKRCEEENIDPNTLASLWESKEK